MQLLVQCFDLNIIDEASLMIFRFFNDLIQAGASSNFIAFFRNLKSTHHFSKFSWTHLQVSKLQNLKANIVCGSTPELRRSSSFDRTWEENVAESVANELVLQAHSSNFPSSKSGPLGFIEQQDDPSRNKLKDSKPIKSGRSSHEEKKVGKSNDDKRSRPRKMMEFHNIKISQVGSVFAKS